jgi:hypothetical protein
VVLVAGAVTFVSDTCGSQVDTARTQTNTAAEQAVGARSSIGVWIQSGPASFHTDKLGGFSGARLFEWGVRWHHTLHRSGGFAVVAIPDLVTISSLSQINEWRTIGYGARLAEIRTKDGQAYGIGTLPLAVRAALDERKPVSAFLDLSAGLHYFSRAIPDDTAARLNAQLMGGAGLRGAIGKQFEAELAYRLVHISNGGTAKANPGLNFRQIAVGVVFPPRKR